MSRSTTTNFPGAYRVVFDRSGHVEYKGPYQTLSAAKGQLTYETSYYRGVTGYIEKTPDGAWEKVESE